MLFDADDGVSIKDIVEYVYESANFISEISGPLDPLKTDLKLYKI